MAGDQGNIVSKLINVPEKGKAMFPIKFDMFPIDPVVGTKVESIYPRPAWLHSATRTYSLDLVPAPPPKKPSIHLNCALPVIDSPLGPEFVTHVHFGWNGHGLIWNMLQSGLNKLSSLRNGDNNVDEEDE